MIALSPSQTQLRFGVPLAIQHFPSNLTASEERNVKTVLNYMSIAYSPERNTGAGSVSEFCAPDNVFEAPSTFPDAHTAEEYAGSHSKVLGCLTDLHIEEFQIVNVKENFVSLRYTATGSHIGKDHNGIPATHKRGHWSGSGNFVLDEETGLIKHWWKDWDKMRMWKGLGWARPDNDKVEFA